MLVAAVKAQDHDLVERIIGGRGPKSDGLNNSDLDETSVESADDFGDSVLIWSCMVGDEKLVELLIRGGASLKAGAQSDGDTPLHRAVKFQHDHIVRQLVEGTPPKRRAALLRVQNFRGQQPLHFAAKYGLDELAEYLMEHGADPSEEDDEGRSALAFAEAGGHELCAAVLEDPEAARRAAAARAAEAKYIKNNLDLLEAAELGNEAWVVELLDAGADIHFRDKVTGNQALHLSAKFSHDGLSKLLLKRGADPISSNEVRRRGLFVGFIT